MYRRLGKIVSQVLFSPPLYQLPSLYVITPEEKQGGNTQHNGGQGKVVFRNRVRYGVWQYSGKEALSGVFAILPHPPHFTPRQEHKVFAGVFSRDSTALYSGNPNVETVVVDVTCQSSVDACFRVIRSKLDERGGELAGVVNNAGVFGAGPAEMASVEAYRQMNSVNVEGVLRVCKAAIPFLREADNGRLVNVASVVGRVAVPNHSHYCATKFAVRGITRCLYQELSQFNINVCSIEPGVFPGTDIFNTYEKELGKLWDDQTDEVKKAYGPTWLEQVRASMKDTVQGGNSDPSIVPEAMMHALLSPKPLRVYRPGRDSKALLFVPDSFLDNVMRSKAAASGTKMAEFENKIGYILTALGASFLLAKL